MVSGSFTDEFSSPVAVDRLWKAGILDTHNLMPKIAPDYVKSVEVLEGNGGVGTVKKFNFTDGKNICESAVVILLELLCKCCLNKIIQRSINKLFD